MSQEKIGKKWRYLFRHEGKPIRSRLIYRTKTDAKEAEAEHRRKLKNEKPVTDMTFFELCERAIDFWEEAQQSKDWIRTKKYMIRRDLQDWMHLKWDEITRNMIREKMQMWRKRASSETANKYLRAIRTIYNVGIEEELIPYNVTARIKFYPIVKQSRYLPPEKDIEAVKLLATPMDQKFFEVIYHTLGRVGEIFRLRWEDVDFDERSVTLWTRKKNDRSLTPRYVPINDELYEVLRWLWRRADKKNPYVFPNPKTGEPYGSRRALLRNLCVKAGVRRFGFHALRHHAASKLLKERVDIATIQELLGHESVRTTQIYLHALTDQKREAMNLLSKKSTKRAPNVPTRWMVETT